MDLDTKIDVETCHFSDNGLPQRYPGLQRFFFGEARKSQTCRQDIGQFHSPPMKPCKSADYFIQANCYIKVGMKQGGLPRN